MADMQSLSLNRKSDGERPVDAYQARPLRRRTLLSGKLVYGDGDFTVDCAIRDISEGGAKIVLTRHQSLPAELHLIVAKYCVVYHAKIMWVSFPARGLKFEHAYPLGDELPRDLHYLYRLWLDLGARAGGHPVTGNWVPED
jgi:hypothetical protein